MHRSPLTTTVMSLVAALALVACKERSEQSPALSLPPDLEPATVEEPRAARLVEPRFPTRPRDAMSGSEFLRATAMLTLEEREAAVYREVMRGNVPAFQRQLVPVTVRGQIPDGYGGRRPATAIVHVIPDYLAIGNDDDYVRMPMGFYTAARIARELGFILPTDRIVDAVAESAQIRVPPRPMRPGPEMVTNAYFAQHHERVQEQIGFYSLGLLVSGIKKDIVLSARLNDRPGRIVIYGWHQPDGQPIQRLSTAHHATYADYSHGVRLVSNVVEIDGRRHALQDLIADWTYGSLFASEGPLRNVKAMMHAAPESRMDLFN